MPLKNKKTKPHFSILDDFCVVIVFLIVKNILKFAKYRTVQLSNFFLELSSENRKRSNIFEKYS